MDKDLMRVIYAINGTNVFVNDTKGIQNLHETRELMIEGFNDVCKKAPTAEEPLMGVLVRLVDAATRRCYSPWACSDNSCCA